MISIDTVRDAGKDKPAKTKTTSATPKPKASKAPVKKVEYGFKRIRDAAGVIHYLDQQSIKEKMACSIKKINQELKKLEGDKEFNTNEAKLNLKEQHEAYVAWAYGNAGRKVEESIRAVARYFVKELGNGDSIDKVKLHPDDIKYIKDLADDKKPLSLPKLDPPTEKDAKNCDLEDDDDDGQPPKKKQKTTN